MGTRQGFSCPQCGYHVRDMSSGYDVGMLGHGVAISCADCSELRNAWLPGSPWSPEGKALAREVQAGRLPPSIVCERGADHRIAVWTAPGACPRCEAILEPDGSISLWD